MNFEEWAADNNPKLLEQWDYEKNYSVTPKDRAPRSNLKVWWICEKGHSWSARIADRTGGQGCPYCSGRRAWPGFNDLQYKEPLIAAEWHPTLNGDVKPTDVTPGSSMKVWWRCPFGHEWQSVISDRLRGDGCPYCSGHRLLTGFNDLQTVDSKLCFEWHPTLNGDLKPTEVTKGSHRKVWWKCDNGHEWEATVKGRASGKGCPFCSGRKVLKGFNDLESKNDQLAKEWHPYKNDPLRPSDVTPFSNKVVWWKCQRCGNEWKAAINSRSGGSGCNQCSRSMMMSFEEKAVAFYLAKGLEIVENYHSDGLKRFELDCFVPSLNLAAEYDGEIWHTDPERDEAKNKLCNNLGIRLIRIREKGCPTITGCDVIHIARKDRDGLNKAISKLVETINQDYGEAIPSDIDVERDRLQISELKYVSKLESSLGKVYPDLAKEIHPTKNGSINAFNIPAHYNGKVWWLCPLGHEFYSDVNARTTGIGCPICSNRKIISDYNSLAATHSDLSKEWNFVRNDGLTPEDVVSGSSDKVWWVCYMGHEWQAVIYSRVAGRGCPYCSNKMVWSGFNDLETKRPDLAEEWHPTKNKLPASEVLFTTRKKYWWLGKCGHEWEAIPGDRVRGAGCPYCNSKWLLKGFNDFAFKHPEYVEYWDYEKNPMGPDEIMSQSNKKYHWKCELGHRWETSAVGQIRMKGCPYCSNAKVLPGFNDLATKREDLAKEWHPTKNKIGPDQVTPGSNKKVWWMCEKGHEWEATINSRASRGYGCRRCYIESRKSKSKCQRLNSKVGAIWNRSMAHSTMCIPETLCRYWEVHNYGTTSNSEI